GNMSGRPFLIEEDKPRKPLAINGANSKRRVQCRIKVSFQDFPNLRNFLKASLDALLTVGLLLNVPPDPQGVSHGCMHGFAPSCIERKSGWVHVRAFVTSYLLLGWFCILCFSLPRERAGTVMSFVLLVRFWVICQRFQHSPCRTTEFKRNRWGRFKAS